MISSASTITRPIPVAARNTIGSMDGEAGDLVVD